MKKLRLLGRMTGGSQIVILLGVSALLLVLFSAGVPDAQLIQFFQASDPGVRGGAPGAGGAIDGLTPR